MTALDLWTVALDEGAYDAQVHVLSPDERQRARRYCFDEDRRRFVASRAALRGILGEYLGVPASLVEFEYRCRCGNSHCRPVNRKPAIVSTGGPQWQFNLSHSGSVAVVVVSWNRDVGVDIEWTDAPRLREMTMTPEQTRESFFIEWVRKEALGKATGLGLIEHLGTAGTELPVAVPGWTSYDLQVPPGYAGAVAFSGPPAVIRSRIWAPFNA